MKQCFKCLIYKPLAEFYKHKAMADGHVNKCKTCNKADVIANREAKIEYYRQYDRERGNRQSLDDLRLYREQNPKKYKAHSAVNSAVKSGKLVPMPCESCGQKEVHGHHCDYDKPLDVNWLCAVCHKQWHKVNGEGLNA